MKTSPFNQPGEFYKGNLHAHSTNSDGRLPPEEVCRRYLEAGYDFLALTDHHMEKYDWHVSDTHAMRAANFTTLIGAELHSGRTELGNLWHLLALGLPLDFAPPARDESGPQLAQRALATGAWVAAVHPAWYCLSEADILSLGVIHAIEVYNGRANNHNGRGDSWYIADLLFARGQRYSVCANDDTHFMPGRPDFGMGWVHVKSRGLQPASLLEALRQGSYYASTGPQIHDVQLLAGNKVRVRCSNAVQIIIAGVRNAGQNQSGKRLREAELSLRAMGESPYFRVVVRDAAGREAWTSPHWME